MNAATIAPAGWRAELRLHYAARGAQTYLARREHLGPLRVQRPFYPEAGRVESGTCHTYIVHPPGGVVGGDELYMDIDVADGAQVLLTTPAATKYYRSEGRIARQVQRFSVAAGNCEWLPQESIYHSGAWVRSSTRIELNPGSRFIGWEIPCLGLPASAGQFETGRLALDLELWAGAKPLFVDRLRVDGERAARGAVSDLAGHHAIGTMLGYPADREMLSLIRSVAVDQVQLAVTLVDGVLMCRGLAAQAEPIKRAFIAVWQLLRPALLGREATLPRIWAM